MSQRVPVHFAGTNGPLGPLISPSHRHLDSDSGMRPFLHTPSVAGDPKCRRTCTPAPPVRAGVQLKLQPLFFFLSPPFLSTPCVPASRRENGEAPPPFFFLTGRPSVASSSPQAGCCRTELHACVQSASRLASCWLTRSLVGCTAHQAHVLTNEMDGQTDGQTDADGQTQDQNTLPSAQVVPGDERYQRCTHAGTHTHV